MEFTKFARKPFVVNAVQVTMDNYEEVAQWCGGKAEMVKTRIHNADIALPCVKIQGNGPYKDKTFTAYFGFWVVENNKSFRTYKPAQFEQMFDEVVVEVVNQPMLMVDGDYKFFASSTELLREQYPHDTLVRVTDTEHNAHNMKGFVKSVGEDDGILVEFSEGEEAVLRPTQIEKYFESFSIGN